jgi:hypothetical protein
MKPGSGVVEVSQGVSHPDPPSLIHCTVSLRQEKAANADLAGHEYFAIHRDAILPRTEWVRPDGWVLQETQGFHGPAIGVSGGSHLGIPAS